MVLTGDRRKCATRIKAFDGYHGCNQKHGHKGPCKCSHFPDGFPKGSPVVSKGMGGKPGSDRYAATGEQIE
jgi:hypothetical protein